MKKASTLKKVTIAAIVLTLVAMAIDIITVRVLKIWTYESPAFMPVHFATLLMTNILGGCVFVKFIKSTALSKMGEETVALYKKIRFPFLWGSAILVIIDCAKDAFLRPDATSASASLIAAWSALWGVATLLMIKDDPSRDKPTFIFFSSLLFLASALALVMFVLTFASDITTVIKMFNK